MTQELRYDVRALKYFRAARDQLCSLGRVVGVWIARQHPAARLDMNFEPGLGQIWNYGRHERYPALARINLLGHTYDHVPSFLIDSLFGRKPFMLCARSLTRAPRVRIPTPVFHCPWQIFVSVCMLIRNGGRSD